ncbi:MAG: hypothetical protein LBE32_03785 [Burkholderiales bacterium]|nr:hypothetical protein [Burkholderiales bacterium]
MKNHLTRHLTQAQFDATFSAPMRRLSQDEAPPFDFWPYYDALPHSEFQGHQFSGDVEYVYENSSGTFQHVLVNSENQNVFLGIVLGMTQKRVYGHRVLDFASMYGLQESPP